MRNTMQVVIRAVVVVAVISISVATGWYLGSKTTQSQQVGHAAEEKEAHEMLNAALWQQTSGEYEAVTTQIYKVAQERLKEALADKKWSAAIEQDGDFAHLPPAIMADLDETVFNNTCYEARIIRQFGQYSPETFNSWCDERRSGSVAGAREFFQEAAQQGVTVFYFSGRPETVKAATVANLRQLGFPLNAQRDTVLLSPLTNAERRRAVAKEFRILLLVGDNLDDFMTGSKDTPQARVELARRHRANWGTKWIVLPNGIYGHWEAALYDFDYGRPRAEMLRRKIAALNDCRN